VAVNHVWRSTKGHAAGNQLRVRRGNIRRREIEDRLAR
jgi:hypothetical protein